MFPRGILIPPATVISISTHFHNRRHSLWATLRHVLGNVRTFALLNEDFSVLKDFALYEAHRIQFRAEFFNVLNRVVFGAPSANLNAPATFGQNQRPGECASEYSARR